MIARALHGLLVQLETEADVGARPAVGKRAGHGAHADDPDRPLFLDDGQVVERVLGMSAARRRATRRRNRDRLGRHPLAHARLARMDAPGERTEEVARRDDPDQAAVVGDERGADSRGSSSATSPSVSSGATTSGSSVITSATVPLTVILPRSTAAAGPASLGPGSRSTSTTLRRQQTAPRRPTGRAGEERRESPADELRRRPPERVDARLPASARGDVAAEDTAARSRSGAGREDRPERLRVTRPRVGRDRLGSGVRLLGGEPALLDGEAGDVARRVDVREPVHAAVAVDGDEPSRVCGTPSMRWPLSGQRQTTLSASIVRGQQGSSPSWTATG